MVVQERERPSESHAHSRCLASVPHRLRMATTGSVRLRIAGWLTVNTVYILYEIGFAERDLMEAYKWFALPPGG